MKKLFKKLIEGIKNIGLEQVVTYVLGGGCLIAIVFGLGLIVYHILMGGYVDHNGSF